MAKKPLKKFAREVVITIRDTDVDANKVQVNMTFNPTAMPGEATTAAVDLALSMFALATKPGREH